MADRLLDVERHRAKRWTGSRVIVPLPTDRCLRCGGPVATQRHGQLPLFMSHGYGAVLQTTLRVCTDCRRATVVDVTEVSPRG